jgi:predicted DCC family thiol-disulfide oxidoreductase YuxK
MISVFYDRNCGFCSNIIERIRKGRNIVDVRFYHISQIAEFLSDSEKLAIEGTDSIIVIDNSNVSIYSNAIIKLFLMAGGLYETTGYCMLIMPRRIRDSVYKFIARNRYRLFGKSQCKNFI